MSCAYAAGMDSEDLKPSPLVAPVRSRTGAASPAAEVARDLLRQVRAAAALHTSMIFMSTNTCAECGRDWPCATLQELGQIPGLRAILAPVPRAKRTVPSKMAEMFQA